MIIHLNAPKRQTPRTGRQCPNLTYRGTSVGWIYCSVLVGFCFMCALGGCSSVPLILMWPLGAVAGGALLTMCDLCPTRGVKGSVTNRLALHTIYDIKHVQRNFLWTLMAWFAIDIRMCGIPTWFMRILSVSCRSKTAGLILLELREHVNKLDLGLTFTLLNQL